MIPKKYHAIAFVSILVMLLLLGLHLLGFGLLGGPASSSAAAARAAALARNSSAPLSSSSSLLSPSGASSTSVYRHPIVYDKLTGATNNQISEVLGQTKPLAEQYPLDHYQQQAQLRQQPPPQPPQSPFDQFAAGQEVDPFANLPGRQGFPPPPPLPPHQMGAGRPGMMMPPPPPPLPPPHHPQLGAPHSHQPLSHRRHQHPSHPHHGMLTTQAPPSAPGQQDSLPSASSVANNGAARPLNSTQQQQQQQQQPVYYTPPIFTYSNNQNPFDPSQQQQQLQAQPLGAYPGQLPPLGVPEAPLSVEDYNARQARLQQQQQQRQHAGQEAQKQPVNLLADPQAQQRHKQQMLDRQFILGAGPASYNEHPQYFNAPPQDGAQLGGNFSTAAYYPDPALYNRLIASQQQQQQQPQQMLQRAPYAHPMSNQLVATQLEAPTSQLVGQQLKQLQAPQNRIMAPPLQHQRPAPTQSAAPPPPPSSRQQQQAAPQTSGSVVRAQQPTQQLSSRLAPSQETAPSCARQQQPTGQLVALELANTTGQLPVLFCNEDQDYPTSEIMRALENFAVDRSIEQILPQQLVQMLVQTATSANNNQKLAELQRQLSLDALQPNINAQSAASEKLSASDEQLGANFFPSSQYEPLCRAATWMAQPRRAKNLLGQWKVVVNLPGHKYRGIAISQMVRIEECTRPNGECASPPTSGAQQAAAASTKQAASPAARCLQQYENQRLLAWSHQQGLHFDIFRTPSACSCHTRRL